MWQLLPTVLLLLVCPGIQAADRPKAVVVLDPEWFQILREDSVTLKCQGASSPGNNSTKWLHNGTVISSQDSSHFIESANFENSGNYRCQTALSVLSDPVQLNVHADWLLLQTSRLVFQEGEPIRMRCHSWRNKPVTKVTYLRNGRGQKYFHRNSEFYIPNATLSHSGSYFCRGLIGYNNKSSRTVNIIVQDPASPSISPSLPPWPQITFCLLMGLLFVIDTGLYFSIRRNLQSSASNWREPKFQWSRDPQDVSPCKDPCKAD